MPLLPFGELREDVSDYEGAISPVLQNVLPRGDGYGPFKALASFTSALGAACRGYYFARKNDGSIAVFAGTSNKLYLLNNTNGTWTDVSQGSGTYTALSNNAQWQFAQFNNFVLAVQQNIVPQVYDLTSSSNFADLGGSPPQASYVSVVNRFVVLSGIMTNVYRIQWSGLNAITTWTSGVNQSDFQDLPDGGIVRGVAGGEFGIIFQDASIRRMTFAPGSPYIFGIDRISSDDGLFAPYSLVSAGDRIFFISPQGFKRIDPGGVPIPIGKEREDRAFFNDVDVNNIQLVIGSSDPRHTRVFWAYKSNNGTTGQFDKILAYDYILDRFTRVSTSGEYLASLSRPGITLEGVDSAYGSNIDTLTITSFDDISNAALSEISAIDANHNLGFFTGSNLEAILETGEHSGDGKRIFVRKYRPVTDASSAFGSITYRDLLSATASTSSERGINSIGEIPVRKSTRYARGKLRIPAGVTWTFASGLEPDVQPEGER